jgi:nucleoside-diphosphate kinase
MIQRSLVLLKPDRGFVKEHYSTSDENLIAMGNKTLEDCKLHKVDPKETMGTEDPERIGKQIWEWGVDFLCSGPVIAFVFEGPNAISNIRAQVGFTLPASANPGTIRGDYALDSGVGANMRKRSAYNLVHASGTEDEAKFEIDLWFKPEELVDYRRVHEDLYSY